MHEKRSETRDAPIDPLKGRSDSDKRSDYEVVFDRPPPPPFDKPPMISNVPPLPTRLSVQVGEIPPPPLNVAPPPIRDRTPSTRSAGTSAVTPQTDVSSGQDKLSFYPFDNKPKQFQPSTSSVIAEAGSSKGKSTDSQPTSEVEIQSCRKCLEKGRTCISDCPKAKVSKKNKK